MLATRTGTVNTVRITWGQRRSRFHKKDHANMFPSILTDEHQPGKSVIAPWELVRPVVERSKGGGQLSSRWLLSDPCRSFMGQKA
jgi:hypothetical protein